MNEDIIVVSPEGVEAIDAADFKRDLTRHFSQMPEVAKPLLKSAKTVFFQIERALYTASAFISALQASVPDMTLQAVLTDKQKKQIAKGALKLMTKKMGRSWQI